MLGRLARIAFASIVAVLVAMPTAHLARAGTEILVVDTFADSFDGSCDDDCTLRDAVAAAPPEAIVELPAGVYPLTPAGAGGSGDGRLTISRRLTIMATGATGSFIDGTALDVPVFDVTFGGELGLEGTTVFGGHAELAAAARVRDGGQLALFQVSVVGGVGGRAGQIHVADGGFLVAAETLFLDGRATAGPGSIRTAGTIDLIASTVAAGRGRRGGAIAVTGGGVAGLDEVTLAENVAAGRGGALWLAGDAMLSGVTIAHNRATGGGGVAFAAGGRASAERTIVAANGADRHPQCLGRFVSEGRNLDRGNDCGFGDRTDQRFVRARLGSLRANGGPTPTVALLRGSPAVDVGGGCSPRDQRGAPRAGRCDAGAYERVLCRGSVVDIVGTSGDDELSGGREPDTFLGMGGRDELQGSLGADVLCGGDGADHLIGGPGDDLLAGGDGADHLDGEEGTDRCIGGRGDDDLTACEG